MAVEVNLSKSVTKTYADAKIKDILDAPPSGLAGLTRDHDDMFRQLGIHTIRDLGTNRYFAMAGVLAALEGKSSNDTDQVTVPDTVPTREDSELVQSLLFDGFRVVMSGSEVMAIRVNGELLAPAFQFNEDHRVGSTHRIVRELMPRLNSEGDLLGALSWWLTPNRWLGNRRPADLLGTADSQIEFAADQLKNDSW